MVGGAFALPTLRSLSQLSKIILYGWLPFLFESELTEFENLQN